MEADDEGHLWCISQKSELYDINVQTGSYKNYSIDKLIKGKIDDTYPGTIAFDKNANIWIGSNTGLRFFNRKTGEFERFVRH